MSARVGQPQVDPPASPEGALALLLSDARAQEFARHAWWRHPFVASGPVERFRISTALRGSPMRDLVRGYQGDRRVWVTGGDGAQLMVRLDDDDLAVSLHDAGFTITLEFVEKTAHFDLNWGLGLIRDLGYPAVEALLAVTCFLSPGGHGAKKHVDATPFFILQVRGRKRWRVAENHDAPHPLEGWGPSWVTEAPPEFRLRRHVIAAEMPKTSQEFVLGPGDVLYVPGGFWHETVAEEESLSLSLIPRVPSWAQVAVEFLVEHLRAQSDWRAPAYGLVGGGAPAADGRAHLDRLLARLVTQLKGIDPSVLVSRAVLRAHLPGLTSPEIWEPRYERLGARFDADGSGLRVTTVEAEIAVEPRYSNLCRWALSGEGRFSVADAWQRAADMAPSEVLGVLTTLVQAHALALDAPPQTTSLPAGSGE